MNEEVERLLAQDEPAPVTVYNERASSLSPCWLLITPATSCHGRSAGSACLPPNAKRHIALDIGIAGLGSASSRGARRSL